MRLFLMFKKVRDRSLPAAPFRQWGQALAEFALMLPIFLIILFVLIEAAFIIQGYLAVQHAAREAARWAVSYRPVQGQTMDENYCTDYTAGDSVAAFLFTDAGYNCDPNEGDNEWYARRVALIKETAIQRAAGLRIKREALGLTDADFSANEATSGFFGVRVSGNDWYGNMLSDFPGLPGLPVQVEVVHRVELVDPFLRVVAPNGVRVRGRANMVNEGVQVWQPSPTPYTATPSDFTPPPTPVGGNTPTPTHTPTPLPTSTPTAGGYCLDIPFDTVTNTLPFQRGHVVPVSVVDCVSGEPVPDVIVSFSIDELGSYAYSGEPAGNQYAEAFTGGTGVARRTIYANEPTTTTVRAWWDQDGDNTWDDGEPTDSATKIWRLPTDEPYILASKYEVLPLEWIAADVFNHPPLQEPFTLLWCRTSITGGVESGVLYEDDIDVDVDGNALDLAFEVPADSAGYYRLETHSSPSSCGDAGTLVAYSADIYILPQPPDLRVISISYPDVYGDVLPSDEYIPFRIEVENLAPWPVEDTLFDVDLYIDPPVTPTLGQIGDGKQWLSGIEGYGTEAVTVEVRMGPGIHQLWAQVDTTGYVEEQVETNNVFGPIEVEADCTVDSSPYGDDFEDGVVSGQWSTQDIGSGVGGSVAESGGELRITGRGSSIWGNSDNFYFVYQTVSGNFDVRLRMVSPPANSGAKLGVMVRNGLAANSRHVLVAARDADGRRLQFAYRDTDGGGTDYAGGELDPAPSPPVWLRIVRKGADFEFYYSYAEEPTSDDWTYRSSATVGMDDAVLVGIAHASYSSSSSLTSRSEEFVVCQGGGDLSDYDAPGLRECTQLFQAGDFEGNPDRVFEHWEAGEAGAFQRTGYYQHGGAFSMRLHSSLGSYPACTALDPWVAQTVRLPTEVYTTTYLYVEGYRLVGGSLADCSVLGSVDYDDELYVQVQDGAGNPDVLLWPGALTPTPTPVPGPTDTPGPGPTDTPVPGPTDTPTPTPTDTPTPTPTDTPTPTPTPTDTPTPTPTPTEEPCDRDDFDDGVVGAEWTGVDIGNASGGSQTESGGRLHVTGRGPGVVDFWGRDNFRYVYQTLTGDFRIETEITGFSGSSDADRRGLLDVRAGTYRRDPRVTVLYSEENNRLEFRYRATRDGNEQLIANNVTGISLPVWMAIEKQGNTYTAYYSTDGSAWVQPTGAAGGSVTFNMGGTVLAGVGSTSGDWGSYYTTDFEYVEICQLGMMAVTSTGSSSPFEPLAPSAPSAPAAVIFSANFDGGTDGFSYQDDTFRGTSQPAYASGDWLASGGYSGGGLRVNVGGIDTSSILNMSGGWRRTFNLSAASEVTVTFRYRLTQQANYEADEYSDMLMSVDGILHGTGSNDYVARVTGDGEGGLPISTGWQLFQVNLGTLSAGDHTLIIGGYNNKKTYNNESTEALLDDVVVDAADIPPTPTPTPTLTPTPGPSPTPTLTPTPSPEAPPDEWVYFDADFTGAIDLEALAGQEVAIRFYATHDADEYGTWFYLDDVQCNVCSDWPIPDPVDGTASFGGLVRGMTGAVPQVLTGVRVMAYSRGGQVYRTLSIHDGTYHFYNVPPGTYTVYAEAWAGGYLLVDSATVTVVANERNYGVNLLLQ
jgi:hypothetical protein